MCRGAWERGEDFFPAAQTPGRRAERGYRSNNKHSARPARPERRKDAPGRNCGRQSLWRLLPARWPLRHCLAPGPRPPGRLVSDPRSGRGLRCPRAEEVSAPRWGCLRARGGGEGDGGWQPASEPRGSQKDTASLGSRGLEWQEGRLDCTGVATRGTRDCPLLFPEATQGGRVELGQMPGGREGHAASCLPKPEVRAGGHARPLVRAEPPGSSRAGRWLRHPATSLKPSRQGVWSVCLPRTGPVARGPVHPSRRGSPSLLAPSWPARLGALPDPQAQQ